MKADPDAQLRLLDLQAIDTALAQLAHKRRTLPEHAALDALALELSKLEDERVRAEVAVDDLDRDIARMERDVDQVRARKSRDQSRLDAGTGPARELEALQHELASLQRRQTELEDVELDLMEQRERSQATLDEVNGRLTEARRRREEAEGRRERILGDLARDEEFRVQARGPLAADLPADLIALYTKIRESAGGLAAAMVRGGRCGGCRLDLSGSERARVKAAAPDEIVRCDECRRIMVRTAESGL